MIEVVTYGKGGFDPAQPAANVVATETLAVERSTEQTNDEQLRSKAAQALATNAAFLALATPTNLQVVAQVQRLTKECNALIRLMLNALGDVSDA